MPDTIKDIKKVPCAQEFLLSCSVSLFLHPLHLAEARMILQNRLPNFAAYKKAHHIFTQSASELLRGILMHVPRNFFLALCKYNYLINFRDFSSDFCCFFYNSRPKSTRWDHVLLDVLRSVGCELAGISVPNSIEALGVQIITGQFNAAQWCVQVWPLHSMPVVDDKRGRSESALARLLSTYVDCRHLFECIANCDRLPDAKDAG